MEIEVEIAIFCIHAQQKLHKLLLFVLLTQFLSCYHQNLGVDNLIVVLHTHSATNSLCIFIYAAGLLFPPSGTPFCMADAYNHKFDPSAKCYADVNAATLYHPPFLAKFTITIL